MSSATLVWLVIGTVLIVTELMTGTFYLLIFGFAAWVGAASAYFNYGVQLQLAVAGVAALIGLIIVVPYDIRRRSRAAKTNDDLDIGNDVTVETVAAARLRVNYRGASWDAVIDGDAPMLKTGDVCVITSVRGNTLVVRPRG